MQIFKMIYCYYIKKAKVYFWNVICGYQRRIEFLIPFNDFFLINNHQLEKGTGISVKGKEIRKPSFKSSLATD